MPKVKPTIVYVHGGKNMEELPGTQIGVREGMVTLFMIEGVPTEMPIEEVFGKGSAQYKHFKKKLKQKTVKVNKPEYIAIRSVPFHMVTGIDWGYSTPAENNATKKDAQEVLQLEALKSNTGNGEKANDTSK